MNHTKTLSFRRNERIRRGSNKENMKELQENLENQEDHYHMEFRFQTKTSTVTNKLKKFKNSHSDS